ncbi:hypothetical protein B0H14DRAFT_3422227 [Mycena olivaceomarginata]|nr:hypothetical protein B0H14DRAFT_3422227 [Mycena olivaceomarginata]
MASQQNQEVANVSQSVEPRMPAPSSQDPYSEPTAAPGNPFHPPMESSRPLSAYGGPEDTGTSVASSALPRIPENVQTTGYAPDPRSDYRDSVRRRQSELDWIVPVSPKRESDLQRQKTLQERIDPTLQHARLERGRCELKARLTGYALNIAIGLQVLLGALTTGLAAVTSGRHASVATSILGGFSTLVASYLARARGSNEPELSTTKVKDMDQFIRDCEVFILDFGHLTGNEHDEKLNQLRHHFEELLGNANG